MCEPDLDSVPSKLFGRVGAEICNLNAADDELLEKKRLPSIIVFRMSFK